MLQACRHHTPPPAKKRRVGATQRAEPKQQQQQHGTAATTTTPDDTDAVIFKLLELFEVRAERHGVKGLLFCLLDVTRIAKWLKVRVVTEAFTASVKQALRIMIKAGHLVYKKVDLRTIDDYRTANLLTAEEATFLRTIRDNDPTLPETYMPSQGFLIYSIAIGNDVVPFWLAAEYRSDSNASPERRHIPKARIPDAVATLLPKLVQQPLPIEYRCAACLTPVASSSCPRETETKTSIGRVFPNATVVYERDAMHCGTCTYHIGQAVLGDTLSVTHSFDMSRVKEVFTPWQISYE